MAASKSFGVGRIQIRLEESQRIGRQARMTRAIPSVVVQTSQACWSRLKRELSVMNLVKLDLLELSATTRFLVGI